MQVFAKPAGFLRPKNIDVREIVAIGRAGGRRFAARRRCGVSAGGGDVTPPTASVRDAVLDYAAAATTR